MRAEEVKQMIEQEKVIAIVRGIEADKCMKVADALYEGGIRLMEVTFNLKDPDSYKTTTDCIRAISEKYEGRMLVGAGTVVTPEQVEMTAQAGGRFIISPNTNVDVIRRTVELDMVSMPGALTPTEVMVAHEAGAGFVKIFPAGDLGPGYIKAIKAPLSHVKMTAVGGVNADNFAAFLKAGAVGAGIGGNLANKARIDAGEFYKITETAAALVAIAKNA